MYTQFCRVTTKRGQRKGKEMAGSTDGLVHMGGEENEQGELLCLRNCNCLLLTCTLEEQNGCISVAKLQRYITLDRVSGGIS